MPVSDAADLQRLRVLKHSKGEEDTIFKDIWEAEAFLAEREAERLLQGDIFDPPSFPPTPPPTPRPNPATPAPTPVPDCLNGRTREQYLFDQLSLITSPDDLLNPSTPEGQAFTFMNNDPLQPDVCTYPIDQRYGLATLYFSTDGNGWTNNQNWLGATTECNWFGIVCNDGVLASNITMRANNMVGPLPDEISTVYAMTQMLLSENSLTSTIPVGISNMTQLCVLDLEMNLVSGNPIPGQILVLTNLKQLLLSDNLFEQQQLPNDIGLMSSLTALWLASNGMIGPIPTTIGQLTGLQSLFLSRNEFTGTIPTEIGFLTDLTNLQMFQNVFVNEVPEQLYGLDKLSVLRLNRNFLQGTVSPNIGNLDSLVDLRFDENILEGNLPFSLSQLSSLQELSFASNRIEGTIPNVFGTFNALEIADFSSNAFNGPLPSSLFDINAIRLLYLNGNELAGGLPATYANPPVLEDLFLNNNRLSGPVPPIASGQLTALNEFTVQGNSFTGSMPSSVCSLRTTGFLDNLFADCGGPNPQILCDFPSCCTRCFQDA